MQGSMRRLVELGKHESYIQPAGSRGAENKEQSKQENKWGQLEEPILRLVVPVGRTEQWIALELPVGARPRVSDGHRRAWG